MEGAAAAKTEDLKKENDQAGREAALRLSVKGLGVKSTYSSLDGCCKRHE